MYNRGISYKVTKYKEVRMSYLKIAVLSAMVLVIGNGCASYMVYKNSEQKVAAKKAFAKGDQAAIKAVQLGNDGVGIGIDVSNWEG